MFQLKTDSTQTNILLSLLVVLMALVVILQYITLQRSPNNLTTQSVNQVATPSPLEAVTPSSTPQTSLITWNQQGIPVVRGEFAHYTSSDDCVALVIDQPVTTTKPLETYVNDYTSLWSKDKYPRSPVQYDVGNYESITLEAMNMEELSNTFVKNGNSVYKMTAMMISNAGAPVCQLDYTTAIKQLLLGLRFNQQSTGNQELGYIKKAYDKDNQQYIDIDYIDWIEDPSAPNGFKLSNVNPVIRTLKVSPSAKIYLIDWTDGGMIVPQISFSELVSVINGTSANYNLGPGNQLFDIDFDKNSLVTKISLRYTP